MGVDNAILVPKVFTQSLRELEITDKAKFDTFNPLFNTLINNDAFLREHIDNMATDYVRSPAWGPATGTVNVYTFSAMPATILVDGMCAYIDNVIATNTGASTLNWSGLGAKAIVDSKGVALTAGKIPLGCIFGVRYNASASNFQLLGEGGDGDISTLITAINSIIAM